MEKWKQNTLVDKVYRLKRESALLGLVLCCASSDTAVALGDGTAIGIAASYVAGVSIEAKDAIIYNRYEKQD